MFVSKGNPLSPSITRSVAHEHLRRLLKPAPRPPLPNTLNKDITHVPQHYSIYYLTTPT